MRKPLLSAIILFLAAYTSAQTARAGAPNRTLPDVYLITIDTLRADHVKSYGYGKIETPALDALAQEGVRFTQAFTPSPITNTSHTTILTGLLPSVHGVTDFAIPLAPNHATWAELLKQKKYKTAAFIGAVILDSKTLAPGLDRGFDFYDNFPANAPSKSRWGRVERRGSEVVQHAEKWLTAKRTGPHFLWVHLYDPHDPYEPPTPFSQMYKDRLYDGEVAYADSVVAEFVSYLKKAGLYQNAVIIVVGDHGEGLGEHGEETHGIFLYDSTTRVPLIIKLPKAVKPQVVDAQVRTTDILPTVLDLLSIKPPAELSGTSLQPYFSRKESTDRVAWGETDYPLRFGWAPLRSVRTEGLKYIEAPKPELYDLKADRGEVKNLYNASDAKGEKLKGMLAEQRAKTGASAAPENAALPDPKDKIEEQNLLHRAMLASDDNRPADARSALEKVLQLDPKSPTALRQLGELELQAGNHAKAAGYLKRSLEVRPDDSTAAYQLGQAIEKTGDLAGARDALESSLKALPGQLPARLLLGKVYLGLKDAKAAQDQFEAALLVDSNSVDAQLGLAKAFLAEGNAAEAVQQLEPLTRTQTDNANVFEAIAEAYKAAGKTVEAQQANARAQELRAKKPGA
jgi:arylsulfatase A-like enzyme/cytochrome c-type biogenesis protein CcmH/NrfG